MPAVTTLAIVGAGLAIAGTATSAVMQYQAGQDQKKALKKQAGMEREAAAAEADNIRAKGRRVLASQRAGLAGSGVKVDTGTGDLLQQETVKLTEQDALATLKGGANRASLLKAQAKTAGQQAVGSLVAGGINVASQTISGVNTYNKAKAAVKADKNYIES